MKEYFETDLEKIRLVAEGAIIEKIEHDEKSDEGFIMTLSTGVVLKVGWSSYEGQYELVNI